MHTPGMELEPTQIAESLRLARADAARLERRQRVLSAVSLAALVLLSARAVVGSPAPCAVGLGAGLALAVAGLVVARRWQSRLSTLRADVFWLELLLDAAEHEAGPRVTISAYRHRAGEPVVVLRRPELLDRTPQPAGPAATPAASRGLPWRAALGGVALFVMLAMLVEPFHSTEDASSPARQRWTFTEPTPSVAELGLVTPVVDGGRWLLEDHEHATGGRALVNHAGKAEGRPALALTTSPPSRDVRVSTRCKVGETGTACGLVFRFRDEANHYVTHVDAASDRISLGVVFAGKPRTLVSVPANAEHGVWQELAVEARSSKVAVFWNGRKVIDAEDAALVSPGGVGLWAPSADVAFFDELSVESLPVGAHPVELLPLMNKEQG